MKRLILFCFALVLMFSMYSSACGCGRRRFRSPWFPSYPSYYPYYPWGGITYYRLFSDSNEIPTDATDEMLDDFDVTPNTEWAGTEVRPEELDEFNSVLDKFLT